MTLYILLFALFLMVFGWLAWRIVIRQATATPPPEATYVCPVCNEAHCNCHKKNDDG